MSALSCSSSTARKALIGSIWMAYKASQCAYGNSTNAQIRHRRWARTRHKKSQTVPLQQWNSQQRRRMLPIRTSTQYAMWSHQMLRRFHPVELIWKMAMATASWSADSTPHGDQSSKKVFLTALPTSTGYRILWNPLICLSQKMLCVSGLICPSSAVDTFNTGISDLDCLTHHESCTNACMRTIETHTKDLRMY